MKKTERRHQKISIRKGNCTGVKKCCEMLFWEEIPSRGFFSSLLEMILELLVLFWLWWKKTFTSSSRFHSLFKEIHSKVTINVGNARVIGVAKSENSTFLALNSRLHFDLDFLDQVEHLTNLTKRIKCASSSKTNRVVSNSWLKLFKMSWPNAF